MIHVPFYSTVRYFCVTFHSEMNWEFLKLLSVVFQYGNGGLLWSLFYSLATGREQHPRWHGIEL